MLVFHATKLSDGDALAGYLEGFVAGVLAFARLTALGGGLVGGGHGTVFDHILFGFFVRFSRYRNSSCLRNEYEG
jgi:hypothetical protein